LGWLGNSGGAAQPACRVQWPSVVDMPRQSSPMVVMLSIACIAALGSVALVTWDDKPAAIHGHNCAAAMPLRRGSAAIRSMTIQRSMRL
jgi:hypothetical protein